jgi:7-cyano-7-deazaguanine synthase
MKDCLIVVSGGMDSVTLLHEYKERIALAVTFDYHSRHAEHEIACARFQCALLGIRHEVVELPFFERYFNSSLLPGGEAVPEGHYTSENMQSTVVPFRNGIMLAIAAGMAESAGLKYLLIANHAGDHAIYPDCREEFIRPMNLAIKNGTYAGVEILAPYTLYSKRDIALRGKELGVDFKWTYSCYKGHDRHCGKCGTCVERKEALAGFDPTEYEA